MWKIKLKVFWTLFYIDYMLNKRGLKNTCEYMKSQKLKVKKVLSRDIEDICTLCNVINTACTKHLLKNKALCLHQSLVGFYILTKMGYDIRLCIGVSKKNFMAHAWLEYKGYIVNDTQDIKETHNILFSI
ncbi:hypothetical protein GLN3_14920 [Geobacillus lituanicus]|nr:hypothetical protein GLN3_14920 [Geobacillus lituanicus]